MRGRWGRVATAAAVGVLGLSGIGILPAAAGTWEGATSFGDVLKDPYNRLWQIYSGAVAPDNQSAFVLRPDNVQLLDLQDRTVFETIDLGGPHLSDDQIRVSPDGRRAYIAGGSGWENESHLRVLDIDRTSPTYATVVGDIGLPQAPLDVAITPDGKHVVVLSTLTKYDRSGSLSIIDVDPDSEKRYTVTGTVLTKSWANYRVAISPDGQRAYVTSLWLLPLSNDNGISVIDISDPTAPSLVKQVVFDSTGANATHGIVARGTLIYVAQFRSGKVKVIDTAREDAITRTYDLPITEPREIALSSDGRRLFIAALDSGEVLAMDTATGNIVNRFAVTDSPAVHPPVNLSLSPDNRTLVVSYAHTTIATVVSTGYVPDDTSTLTYEGDASAVTGGPLLLSVRLSDSSGAAVANQRVSFSLGANRYSAVTNSVGLAVVKGKAPATPAEYTIGVTFGGDDKLQGSRVTSSLTVGSAGPSTTKLTYSGANAATSGATGALSATLTDSSDAPLAGKTLTFLVGGQAVSVLTDSTGAASADAPDTAGDYQVEVFFVGNSGYAAAEASATVTVTEGGTTPDGSTDGDSSGSANDTTPGTADDPPAPSTDAAAPDSAATTESRSGDGTSSGTTRTPSGTAPAPGTPDGSTTAGAPAPSERTGSGTTTNTAGGPVGNVVPPPAAGQGAPQEAGLLARVGYWPLAAFLLVALGLAGAMIARSQRRDAGLG